MEKKANDYTVDDYLKSIQNMKKDELTIIVAGNALVGKTFIIRLLKYLLSILGFEITISRQFVDKHDIEPNYKQARYLSSRVKINIIEFYYTKGYNDKHLKRYLYNKNKQFIVNSQARGTCISKNN